MHIKANLSNFATTLSNVLTKSNIFEFYSQYVEIIKRIYATSNIDTFRQPLLNLIILNTDQVIKALFIRGHLFIHQSLWYNTDNDAVFSGLFDSFSFIKW